MPPEPREDEGVQDLSGPDPRTWPAEPDVWDRVQDIRAIDEVLAVLRGEQARETDDPAVLEARRFLAAAAAQQCEELARVLLGMYGVKAGETAGATPFETAGRPRAFGADSPPPAGTLLPGRPQVAPSRRRCRRARLVYGHRLGSRADMRCRRLRR